MSRIGLAFRVFFRILTDKDYAGTISAAGKGGPSEAKPAATRIDPQAGRAPAVPRRSDAVSLLAMLQREARFVDFIQEPIDSYSDEQIGAAVRNVHRGCRTVLEKAFHLEPLVTQNEGERIHVPVGYDPHRIQLAGNVSGQPPYDGALCHHGWQASRCELPIWTGSAQSALIVSPVEIELGPDE